MKTKDLFIAFSAVTAFEVRCTSTASRACRQATEEWPVAGAKLETQKAVPNVMESFRQLRRSVDQPSHLERAMAPKKIESNSILGRSL